MLLDSPYFIYMGTVGGLGAGLVIESDPPEDRANWLVYFAVAGIALGLVFAQLRRLGTPAARLVVGGVLGIALVAGCLYGAEQLGLDIPNKDLGGVLLAGLPFFYVLTFCGEADESEVEIAALCAVLAVGLYLLRLSSNIPEYGDKLILLESMKMVIPIQAPHAGRVGRILCAPGDSVPAGVPLLEIEPHER